MIRNLPALVLIALLSLRDVSSGGDGWALRPLRLPGIPDTGEAAARNPIDAFLLAELREKGLAYSPPADPRTLVRRLFFDLTGLPPSPADVEAFAADRSETAYRALVDRLLHLPEYGERWGRHWLDVARFGESDGFERNHPRDNLWHYRDWVIRAFNEDMPFDRFARLQIAGDVLESGGHKGLAAVGFLVAGVHNTVVGSSPMMQKLAREDELEEIIGALGQTFLGLTVNCARCHDHKFDPIPQIEYYRITAAIDGVYHGEREYREDADAARIAALDRTIEKLSTELSALNERGRERALAARGSGRSAPPEPPRAFASWEFDRDLRDSVGNLHGRSFGGAHVESGALVLDGEDDHVITAAVGSELREKTLEAWVLIEGLAQRGGGVVSVQTPGGGVFDAIVFGEKEERRWMAGSNGFVRWQSFDGPAESEAETRPVHIAIVYGGDGSIQGYRDGLPYGRAYRTGLQRYAPGEAEVVFGLRHSPAANGRMLKGRILRANLYDRALDSGAVAASAGRASDWVPEAELIAQLDPRDVERRRELIETLLRSRDERAALERAAGRIYSVTPKQPGTRHRLRRGDVNAVGEAVVPGAVSALAALSSDFGLDHDSPDADRRRKLAEWVTSKDNPLFPRVAVNRIWHYHFGTGIVATPSDFGANGAPPSHPELLDWLASEFAASGYRVKELHRWIVTSEAFRQSSGFSERAHAVDADNRLLWRMAPRRLEAEALRDAMLAVSGRLNGKRGGPGFRDVELRNYNGTMYYTPFDSEDPELNRRTVYRFSPRGQRSALLETFDCPDPSGASPRRSVTTTPLQALSLLNNAFVIRMARHFAARVRAQAGEAPEAQVREAFRLAFSRAPEAADAESAGALVRDHGLEALCRALFNASEFVIIE